MKVFLCLLLLGPAVAGYAAPPNYAVVEALMQGEGGEKRDSKGFEKAALSAEQWDVVLLKAILPPADIRKRPQVSAAHCGVEAVERDYSTDCGFKTRQTRDYWVLISRWPLFKRGTPCAFASDLVKDEGFQGVKWEYETNWKGHRVFQCTLLPAAVRSGRAGEKERHERGLWARSMRVFEGENDMVVYVEKATPHHSVQPTKRLEGQRQWFRELENSGEPTVRHTPRARWWEFWRWRLSGGLGRG